MAALRAYRVLKVGGPQRTRRPSLRVGIDPLKTTLLAEQDAAQVLSPEAAAPPAESTPADALVIWRRKPWTVGRILRWGLALAALIVLGYVVWLVVAFMRLQSRIYVPLPPTATANQAVYHETATAARIAGETPPPTPPDPFSNLPSGRINILLL